MKRSIRRSVGGSTLFLLTIQIVVSQPTLVSDGIEFIYKGPAKSVKLVGDFIGSKDDVDNLEPNPYGEWKIIRCLNPGICQHKFVVSLDSTFWVLDSANPARVETTIVPL